MNNRLRLEWHLFLLAVQFLTRVPVPKDLPFSDDLLIRATRYYPLVGVCLGLACGVVLWVGSMIWPQPVAVVLSMAAGLALTGAFHEDGLADAADGLGGGLTRERALEIMRDSRIGTYGAVTLGTVLALKASLLMVFDPTAAILALVGGHALGRMAAVHVIATTPYARDVGAKFTVPTVTRDGYSFALACAGIVGLSMVVGFGVVPVAIALLLALCVTVVFRALLRRKLGGYTGDCLGATQQLSEVAVYLGLLAWL